MLNLAPDQLEEPARSGSNAPKLEPGTYPGVISLIVDLGVQSNLKYESMNKKEADLTDKDYDVSHLLWYGYALPTERYEATYEKDDEEVTELRDQYVGERLKVSKYKEANLMKRYNALGCKGSFSSMIGMPVTVTVGETKGGKAKVVSVGKPMKGMAVADPIKEPQVVSSDDWDRLDEIDLPPFIKELIESRVQ